MWATQVTSGERYADIRIQTYYFRPFLDSQAEPLFLSHRHWWPRLATFEKSEFEQAPCLRPSVFLH